MKLHAFPARFARLIIPEALMPPRFARLFALATLLTSTSLSAQTFRVTPAEVKLSGNFAQTQLLVTAAGDRGPEFADDLTPQARFASTNEAVVTVTPAGRVIPHADGTAEIIVTVLVPGESPGAASPANTQKIPVTVAGVVADPQVGFVEQIHPVIYKAGCMMGACHAAQYGQGGFKLSVFGFDPAADRYAIVRDSQGRRINPVEIEKSLFLRKPLMEIPHGGGRRLEKGFGDYDLLAAWLKCGAPGPTGKEREVVRLQVTPNQRNGEPGLTQQLRVDATYSDGEVRDVTAWAKYDSLDEALVEVSPSGMTRVIGRGQAPVMVRFEGQADICTYVIPYGAPATLAGWMNNNFIDELAAAKFRELGIEPSGICDDATFLRRIFLDVTGTLPDIDEIHEFDASTDPHKRQAWIDRLLGFAEHPKKLLYNERYASFWTLKWSDLLQNRSNDLQETGMWAFHNWIKESFRKNERFDQFVAKLVQGKGSSFSSGPANYFIVNNSYKEMAESTSQLFLGVRLTCAQCHHHPFEKYGQDDYYAFGAFFARIRIKGSQEFGLFGGERVVVAASSGEVSQPRTGKRMEPKPLDGEPATHPLDRRIALAEWMTSPQNAQFTRSVANRYWSYLMGRGLVEPVDDMRATNPPSNVPLMNALAEHLAAVNFDLKQYLRTILSSRLYQLDSQPTSQNVGDERFYSHFPVKRLSAEVLLDAIDDAAGTQTKFKELPLGARAIEIPDAEYPDYFLNTFAKPRRASVCECERSPDPNLAQALHTLNGDVLQSKIASGTGRIAKLLQAKKPHGEIVAELYLVTVSRPPTPDELANADRLLVESASPKECYEDLLWALLNTKAFLFVH
jgi:hypothetical protein